ncbi:MAG: hypothetical protein U0359_28000, partial [Byssovorax sp.]
SGCAPMQDACGLACVDLASDANHCGNCNTACKLGETCQLGKCTCTSPTSPCGCVDLGSDAHNCGACNVVCGPSQTCDAGICSPPLPDESDPLAITSAPLPLVYTEPSVLFPLDLGFRDPNGCQPAFCAEVCTEEACSTRFACTAAQTSGDTGTFRSFLGFLAEPSDHSAVFSLDVTPISAPGCPSDLLSRLENGDDKDLRAGAGTRIPVKLLAGGPPDTDDLRCTGKSALCACAVRACTTSTRECSLEVNGISIACGEGCNCAAAALSAEDLCCPKP